MRNSRIGAWFDSFDNFSLFPCSAAETHRDQWAAINRTAVPWNFHPVRVFETAKSTIKISKASHSACDVFKKCLSCSEAILKMIVRSQGRRYSKEWLFLNLLPFGSFHLHVHLERLVVAHSFLLSEFYYVCLKFKISLFKYK
jgi:hypothetical protein